MQRTYDKKSVCRRRDQRRRRLEAELARMLPILKAQESVRRIILFGSLARGRVGERSDVDLVVVQETDQPVLSRVEELYRLVLPEVDMDILVYTPAEFEQLRESRGFVRRLLREGKVLYEPTP